MEKSKKELELVGKGISDFYELDFSKGKINLRHLDARALILPAAAWSTLRDELVRSFKGGAFPLMFQIGYPIGSSFMERFRKLDPKPEAAMRALPEIGSSSGWGSFSIIGETKEGNGVILRVANCPFCSKMGKHDLPVCDFLVGVFNGMVDTLYDTPHEAREKRCEYRRENSEAVEGWFPRSWKNRNAGGFRPLSVVGSFEESMNERTQNRIRTL